jgi:hypothetical protein
MKRLDIRRLLIAAAIMVVAGAGCQKESSDVEAARAPAKPAPLSPQESFAVVIESFRRGVEGIPIGFVVHDGAGGQSMMTGRNTVSYELLPPEKDGEPFKAKITVTSNTQYSLQRSSEKPSAGDSNPSQDAADASGGDPDVQIVDPSIASAPGGNDGRSTTGKADRNTAVVAREENKHTRVYDLVHENGRWTLITELDPNTEESIKLAFDRALGSQS